MRKQHTLRRCVSTVVVFNRKINILKGQWLSGLEDINPLNPNHLECLASRPEFLTWGVWVWVWAWKFAFLVGSWVMVVLLVEEDSDDPRCRYFQQKEVL